MTDPTIAPEERPMRILVSAASKHEATTQIAQAIAASLSEAGVEAISCLPAR